MRKQIGVAGHDEIILRKVADHLNLPRIPLKRRVIGDVFHNLADINFREGNRDFGVQPCIGEQIADQ